MNVDSVIQTERLTLRDFREDDWKEVHCFFGNQDPLRYVQLESDSEECTQNLIRKAIAQRQVDPRRDFWFAVTLKSNGQIIGACSIHIDSPKNRAGNIGYYLSQDFWSQGYGTETAQALIKFGFRQLNLHRISATCDTENMSSVRILEKLGLRRENHLYKHLWQKGRWRDSFIYAILEEEFRQNPVVPEQAPRGNN
jgi:RimJ/RimL family protein N-acetyltransferase